MHILKIIAVSVSLSFLTLTTVFAASNEKELNDYTDIQTLLAKDTFLGLPAAAQKLASDANENHHAALAKASDQLALSKDIKAARVQFEAVSKETLPLAKADKSKKFEVLYCPMKKARWVQKTGSIANPYYGSEMLECGVKE
jgi:hypothetical protein